MNMKNKFILCGTIGWCLEILYTGFRSLKHHEFTLMGTTSIWMFPIYGMASFLSPICKCLRCKNPLIRGGIYTCCIFLGEYLSGSFLQRFHLCPWDYSNARLNIKGIIRLDYAPLWFGTGLLFEKVLK